MNFHDEPRVLKHECSPNEDWRKCACGKNYTIPEHPHGQFIKPCTWRPIYEKLPLLSRSTHSQCFMDILFTEPYYMSLNYRYFKIP